ncbi:MAG: 6-phosphofructokinase [Clostridia bacterium]|jgi:6-phosphofructokinase 1|nr:6-phosphofructokinase [Clostridia bacterium]
MSKVIGVLTSGGDAPGMNAVVRAIVRCGLSKGHKILGVDRGYEGLMNNEIEEMKSHSVSDVIGRGGTILQSARSKQFMTEEGVMQAVNVIKANSMDALIVIGGDGSFKGARELAKKGINVIGIPGTIDLDIDCTDYTIGFDTAVNTAMEAIEKIRDTSSSHNRCSIVEVMGRNAGYIALWCSISGGAEITLIPEKGEPDFKDIANQVAENKNMGKKHELIIVAEGIGKTAELAEYIENETGITTRATILGYLQRGGRPTAIDRIHGSMMGSKAIDLIDSGVYNRIVALKNGDYVDIEINEALNMKKDINEEMYRVAKALAY